MEKTKQNTRKISRSNLPLNLIKNSRSISINDFNIMKAMPFIIILLLSISLVSAGDVVAKAGDLNIDNNLTVDTNTLHVDSTTHRVGIGTTAPGSLLSFPDVTTSSNADGIGWFSGDPLAYGIYKTADAWAGPDYSQLRLRWDTGINLEGGAAYGKSGVIMQLNGGNVGIGTAAPNSKTHIALDGADDSNAIFHQLWISGTTNITKGLGLGYDSTNDHAFIQTADISTAYKPLKITASEYDFNVAAVTPASMVKIDNAGNVGIGTATPISKLEVEDNNNSIVWNIVSRNKYHAASSDYGAGIKFKMSSADTGAEANKWAGIATESEGEYGHKPALAFYVNPDATSVAAPIEKMRLSYDGKLGIGTATPQNPLNVIGDINATGLIYGNGSQLTGLPDSAGNSSFNQTLTDLVYLKNTGDTGIGDYGFVSDKVIISTSAADNTNKQARLLTTNYHTDEEPVYLIGGYFTDTINRVDIGGGTAAANAATSIRFLTAANTTTTTGTERAVIDSSGNVGIGTTSPSAPLHVKGLTSSIKAEGTTQGAVSILKTGNNAMELLSDGARQLDIWDGTAYALSIDSGNVGIGTTIPGNYSTSANNLVVAEAGNAGMTIVTGTANHGNIYFADGTAVGSSYRGIIRYDHADNSFNFYTDATANRLTIDATGNVGIGTTGPGSLLQVSKTQSGETAIRISNRYSVAANTQTALLFDGYRDVADPYTIAKIQAQSLTSVSGEAAQNGELRFYTNNYAVDNLAQRMVITNTGNVGIGTTDPSHTLNVLGTTNLSGNTTIEGDLNFSGDGSGVPYGSIYTESTSWHKTPPTAGVWYSIIVFGTPNGELNEITHDGYGELTIDQAGRYLVNYDATAISATAGTYIEVGLNKSGSIGIPGKSHQYISGANIEENVAGNAILDLAVGDTIILAIRTLDTGVTSVRIEDYNLVLSYLGGT